MKEIDLDRNLDTLIIDGLIKESDMEGIEFAAAMRHISDEAFYAIIHSRVEEDTVPCEMAVQFEMARDPEEVRFEKSLDSDEDDFRSKGMKLVVEHIRNRRKYAAIKELKRLIERTKGTPFGDSCEDLLAKLKK